MNFQAQIQNYHTPPTLIPPIQSFLGQQGRQHAMHEGFQTSPVSATEAVVRRLFADDQMRTPQPPPFPFASKLQSSTNHNPPTPPPSPFLSAQPLSPGGQLIAALQRLTVSGAGRDNLDELDEGVTVEFMNPVANSAELDDEDRVPSRLPGDERVVDFVRKRNLVLDRQNRSAITITEQPEKILFQRAQSQFNASPDIENFNEKDVTYEEYVPTNQRVVGRHSKFVKKEERERSPSPLELNPLIPPPHSHFSRHQQTQQQEDSSSFASSGPSVLTQRSPSPSRASEEESEHRCEEMAVQTTERQFRNTQTGHFFPVVSATAAASSHLLPGQRREGSLRW